MNNQVVLVDLYSLLLIMEIPIEKEKSSCKWCTKSGKIHRENQCGYMENCTFNKIYQFLKEFDALEKELVLEPKSIDAKLSSSECKDQSLLNRNIEYISNVLEIDNLFIEEAHDSSIRRLDENKKVQFCKKVDLQKLFTQSILSCNSIIHSVNIETF
jgi:hypothetical protein